MLFFIFSRTLTPLSSTVHVYNSTFRFMQAEKTKPSSGEFLNVTLNEDNPAVDSSPTTNTTTRTFSTPTLTGGPILDDGQVDHKPTPKKKYPYRK